jgi:CheY-like chemotaxis protein
MEAPTSERRVLIVDDNEDAAHLLSFVLTSDGYATRIAHDGPAALRIAQEFCPDIAVLDIGLPDMDGYELAGKLRDQPSLSKLRMIALTGYGQQDDVRRALDAGFAEHLVKPVDITRFRDAVIRLVALNSPEAEER